MAQTSAGRSPIPPADKDDSEDVAWALSTAEAMHARGDAMEALKWLRRAAEAAAESSADDRALQIAKAAADLASVVGPTSHMPPPPPAPIPQIVPQAPPVPQVVPVARPVHPTQPTQLSRGSAPAQPQQPPQQQQQGQGQTPRAPAVSGQRPLAARATSASGSSPDGAVGARPGNVARRSSTGRRSRPDVVISRPPDEQTQQMEVSPPPPPPSSPAPAARRRGRASRPAAEETTGTDAAFPAPPPHALADVAPPTPIDPGVAAATETPTGPPAHPSIEDMDAWPTQAMGGDALDAVAPGDEQTRIGVPAYRPGADPTAMAAAAGEEPPFHASQAVRVIVWRTADGGVRIAPQGTSVSAISVEAILVALDPNADLAAWLTGK
jgi:hypothetical protein